MTILNEDNPTVNVGHEVTPFTTSKREAHDLEQYQEERSRRLPTKWELALYWRKQGYSIIPVENTRDKHHRKPHVKWTPFQTSYPTLEEYQSWWQKWPDANPTLVCGEVSGVVVIDVDGPEGMKWLQENGRGLTPTFVTGRGAKGRHHFYYQYPEGVHIGCPKPHPEVEIKGTGGLIPLPGSTHWSGVIYKIERNLPLAQFPQWLIDHLTPPEPPPMELHQQRQITGNDERAYLERRAQRWLDKRVTDLASRPAGDHFGPFKALAYYAGWYASPNNRLLTETEVWNATRSALQTNGYLKKHGERTTQQQFRHYWQRGQDMPGQPESLMRAADWWRDKHKVQVKGDFTITDHQAGNPDHHEQRPHAANPHWPNGLPITVRGAFSRYANSAIAPVVELINEAHIKGLLGIDEWVDAKYLFCIGCAMGRNLSEATIRRAMNQGREQFFEILHPVLYRSSESESKNESDWGMESEERGTSGCKKPGRKKHLYRLLPKAVMFKNLLELATPQIIKQSFPTNEGIVAPIHESLLRELGLSPDDAKRVRAELDAKFKPFFDNQPGFKPAIERARAEFKRLADSLNDERTTPFRSGWEYRTTGDYAVCCARALLDTYGGELQRAKVTLARWLGCNPRQVDGLLKRAGGTSEPQYVDRPITSLKQLQAIADERDPEYRGFPKEVVSSLRHNTFPFQDKKCYVWALNEMHQGADVSLRYRQANKWTSVSETRVELQKKPKEAPVQPQPTLFELPPIVVQTWNWFVLKVEAVIDVAIRWYQSIMKPRKAAWIVEWVNGAIHIITPWKVEEDRLIDTRTGEVREDTVQMKLDLLLTAEAPTTETIGEATEEYEHLPWLEDVLDDLLGKEPDDGRNPSSGSRTSQSGDIRHEGQSYHAGYSPGIQLAPAHA